MTPMHARRRIAYDTAVQLRQHTPDHWPAIHALERCAIELAVKRGDYVPTAPYDPDLTDDCPDEHLLPDDDPFELLELHQATLREANRVEQADRRARRNLEVAS
jgi:hypothetical protein